ncbi:MAG: epoxyqueuosine reductase QueH, partial [Lachnospiraceae bacterium]|nr:epoxyqueuosine reductase QueH [Lachnospiraceae bacterium]
MNKINYNTEMESIISSLDGRVPNLLLHSCCAPCSSACLEVLTPHFNVTILYYNPNITDASEYDHRLDEE